MDAVRDSQLHVHEWDLYLVRSWLCLSTRLGGATRKLLCAAAGVVPTGKAPR